MQEFFLTPRQRCDLECLLNGAFAPLTGFCGRDTYESILMNRRLPSGEVWPMPITLPRCVPASRNGRHDRTTLHTKIADGDESQTFRAVCAGREPAG